MTAIRKLACCPNRNLHRCIRRYIGTTGSKSRADKKGSKTEDSKDSDKGDKKLTAWSWYDARKYSHNLPTNNVSPPFEPLPSIPTGVFRCTDGEVIGPLAGKCAYYRNPEYYSFHHMSFFDMHMIMIPFRKPQIKTGRKP